MTDDHLKMVSILFTENRNGKLLTMEIVYSKSAGIRQDQSLETGSCTSVGTGYW